LKYRTHITNLAYVLPMTYPKRSMGQWVATGVRNANDLAEGSAERPDVRELP